MGERTFEVRLEDGRVVEWPGVDGPAACARAADCLGVPAVAWREARAGVVVVHHSQIIG